MVDRDTFKRKHLESMPSPDAEVERFKVASKLRSKMPRPTINCHEKAFISPSSTKAIGL